MKRPIAMDMDGVVFETPQQYYLPPVLAALDHYKVCIDKGEAMSLYMKSAGVPIEDFFRELLTKNGLGTELASNLGAFWKDNAYNGIPDLYDDAVLCLKNLREMGYNIYAWTNLPQNQLERRLDLFGLWELFDRRLGIGGKIKGKTDYKDVIETSVVVSDGVRDIQFASECGACGILIARSDQYVSLDDGKAKLKEIGLEGITVVGSLRELSDAMGFLP